jgi:hypothetical protein
MKAALGKNYLRMIDKEVRLDTLVLNMICENIGLGSLKPKCVLYERRYPHEVIVRT